MALLAISCIGEFSVYSILQVYLVQDAHFSPAGANVAIAAARILTPAAVVVGGVVADRKNPYVVLAGGLSCMPWLWRSCACPRTSPR